MKDELVDVQKEASRTSECTRAGYLIKRVAAFHGMRGSLGRERFAPANVGTIESRSVRGSTYHFELIRGPTQPHSNVKYESPAIERTILPTLVLGSWY